MTAGAVLCGGASRRMGTDKALLAIDGVAMAERVARVLAAAGCDPVALLGGDAAQLRRLGRPMIADRWPGSGPLGGVITALSTPSTRPTPRAGSVVAACDLPCLEAPTIRDVLAAVASAPPGTDVVVARTTRLEPALAWWSPAALPTLEAQWATGVRAVHEAIGSLRSVVVDVDPAALRNVNAPSDVAELHQRS